MNPFLPRILLILFSIRIFFFKLSVSSLRKKTYSSCDSKSGESILFIDKNKWIINDKSNFENYGFFNFRKISTIDIFNKWSISVPEGSNVSIQTLQDGEKILSGDNSLNVTEIFRNYGVNSELRNFWPLIYVNDTLYWIVGLRKSDEAIKNEKKYKSNILVASVEKGSFEDQ